MVDISKNKRLGNLTRMFNGKLYRIHTSARTKTEAEGSAARVRSSGYLVRVTPATRETREMWGARYLIWMRWNKLPQNRDK